jgi:hypothetical protein
VSYGKVGDALAAQGKLQDALDPYQQSLAILRRLVEQDKSNSGWRRDLIVFLYRAGTTMVKLGGNDNLTHAQESLLAGLDLVELYPGPDRQDLIGALQLALENLAAAASMAR